MSKLDGMLIISQKAILKNQCIFFLMNQELIINLVSTLKILTSSIQKISHANVKTVVTVPQWPSSGKGGELVFQVHKTEHQWEQGAWI